MVKARKYVVIKSFEGVPNKADFEIVEHELPPIQENDVLVKTEWISVDPYLWGYNYYKTVPYDQFSFQVGVVIESKAAEYPVGTKIVSHKGWCDYSIIDTKENPQDPIERIYKLPDLNGLSESLGVGAVGMPGATAYFGFLEICQPKAGETVVVTGAAGAIGSLVGQIAKIKGCRVIGFTGSDEKANWLQSQLGFDKAFNYKKVEIAKALHEAAPNGVDCYFDNVGGEMTTAVMTQMNSFGRVAVCGSISCYSDLDASPKATVLHPFLAGKQLKIEGFMVWRWVDRWTEALGAMTEWIRNGQLTVKEHITEGFDNIPDAFYDMLTGKNFGKAVVKV